MSSYNNYKNSTNDQTKKKLLSKEKINSSLIKKCKMTTIFRINNNNNSVSQSIDFNKYKIPKMTNFSQFSKIKVNKIFSPYLEKKSNGSNNSIIIYSNKTSKNFNTNRTKEIDKNLEMKIKKLQNSISSVSLSNYKINNYRESNSIKLINFKIDLDKIKIIQKWWKYIYKIILLQRNIKSFIFQKQFKPKIRCLLFIRIILKIYFKYFNNCIIECYVKFFGYFLKKWHEVTYKKIIIKRLLICKRETKNGSLIFSMNNSIYCGLNNNLVNDNTSMTIGNDSKKINNNSTFYRDNKIFSPSNENVKVSKPLNFQINIKKRKHIICNIYNNSKRNVLNKYLNKSRHKIQSKENNSKIHNTYISNNSSINKNKIPAKNKNKSIRIDNKDKTIKNHLYQNIREYYNKNEITINPTFSSNKFYTKTNKLKKQNRKNIKIHMIQNSINNLSKSKKMKKIPKNNNFKKINTYNNSLKNNSTAKNLHINTFGIMNDHNGILQNMATSPRFISYRGARKNNKKSKDFNNDDLHIVLLLLKVKKCFLYWRNLVFKNLIIKKLRLISKIKYIFYIYKFIHIKIFFAKIFLSLYNNDLCLNIINHNSKLLKIYYNNLKEISRIKKVNCFDTRNLPKIKNEKICSTKYLEKKNSKIDMNNKSKKTDELKYNSQLNQKFSKLNNRGKDKINKNKNIIIINNNINSNCQQLIKEINKNKKINNRENYSHYNNSMTNIQTLTDSSLSCGFLNYSEKNINSMFLNNLIYKKKGNLINNNYSKNNDNTKLSHLCSLFNLMNSINIKNKLKKCINIWKSNIESKKSLNYIDEKIIYLPKSPQLSTNAIENKINYNKDTNNIGSNYFKNNDLEINTVFTENNIQNPKNLFYSAILKETVTPSNKFILFTECNNESNYNINNCSRFIDSYARTIYKKKVLPSSRKKTSEKNRLNNNNDIIFDYSYNNHEKNIKNNSFLDKYFLNSYNNFRGNDIKNFYTSNEFFNKRNYFDLDSIKLDSMLPEDKYGFKKENKIEEREISFSPRLSKKAITNENIVDNNLEQMTVDNLYKISKSICSNYLVNNTANKETNLPIMNHSQSQGFKKSNRTLI